LAYLGGGVGQFPDHILQGMQDMTQVFGEPAQLSRHAGHGTDQIALGQGAEACADHRDGLGLSLLDGLELLFVLYPSRDVAHSTDQTHAAPMGLAMDQTMDGNRCWKAAAILADEGFLVAHHLSCQRPGNERLLLTPKLFWGQPRPGKVVIQQLHLAVAHHLRIGIVDLIDLAVGAKDDQTLAHGIEQLLVILCRCFQLGLGGLDLREIEQYGDHLGTAIETLNQRHVRHQRDLPAIWSAHHDLTMQRQLAVLRCGQQLLDALGTHTPRFIVQQTGDSEILGGSGLFIFAQHVGCSGIEAFGHVGIRIIDRHGHRAFGKQRLGNGQSALRLLALLEVGKIGQRQQNLELTIRAGDPTPGDHDRHLAAIGTTNDDLALQVVASREHPL